MAMDADLPDRFRPFLSNHLDLLTDHRVRRSHELGVRDVAFHQQAFQNPAELGVAFFVSTQISREVIEGAHRAPDVGQGKSGEQLAVGHVLGRKSHRYGEDTRPHAAPAGRHPERGAAANGQHPRSGDRKIVEQKLRRLAPDHSEIGQVSIRVADEKIVDVVLARVHTRRKRCPRRRRLRRVCRSQRMKATLRRQLRHIGKLALLDPTRDERGVHPIESEDYEFLAEARSRFAWGAGGEDQRDARQQYENRS